MGQWAEVCFPLSEAMLDAEGRDQVKLLSVAGPVADCLTKMLGERIVTISGGGERSALLISPKRGAGNVAGLRRKRRDQ